LSKILTTLRLSGAVWIEAWLLHQVVLELVALAGFAFDRMYRRFLREPFKLTKLSSRCQLQSFLFAQGRSNSLLAVCSSYANLD
jgi:hypothetical protein